MLSHNLTSECANTDDALRGDLRDERPNVMLDHYMHRSNLELSSLMVSTISEIPLPTIVQLASTGVITPSLQATSGRGTARRWSFSDTCALRMLAHAREFGIPPVKLKPLIEQVQQMKLTPKSEPHLVLIQRQDGTLLKRPTTSDNRFFKGGPTAFIVDIDELVTETAAKHFELLLRRPTPKSDAQMKSKKNVGKQARERRSRG